MAIVIWAIIGFVSGSMPWAVWLPRLIARADVTSVGDRNPGSANAWKIAGWKLGLLVFLLDLAKGAVPVFLAYFLFDVRTWGLTLVGLAPVLGHAFSPFLGLKGGKALATSGGSWTGVTLGPGFLVIFFCLGLGQMLQKTHVSSVFLAVLGIFLYIAIRRPEPWLFTLWAANTAVIAYKHQVELKHGVEPRGWVLRILRKAS
ncbi:MAG: glycerol-3-phosphate acyltransferase [Chloroflexi bacterium]|nr:glycerol-3-phosphate acyltransferase [Chloroflexota bacterium]